MVAEFVAGPGVWCSASGYLGAVNSVVGGRQRLPGGLLRGCRGYRDVMSHRGAGFVIGFG